MKPECPLCRAALPASHRLVINHELRDLITLANALSTVQAHEDWQQVVASPVRHGFTFVKSLIPSYKLGLAPEAPRVRVQAPPHSPPLCRAPACSYSLEHDQHPCAYALPIPASQQHTLICLQGPCCGHADEDGAHLSPSAPPMPMSLSTVLEGGGDLLSLEKPTWLPDSHALSCQSCGSPFR